jgi:addiction module HigA family antidote
MAQLHNPHPGEILKEEFLTEIGMSQNQLAHAIGVPGNRIHAISIGRAPLRVILICVCASSSAYWKATSCGCRMPMTR